MLGRFCSYTNAMFDLQARMMRIVTTSLGADPDKGFGADVLRDAIIYWRFLHYPPTKQAKVTGAGAHTGRLPFHKNLSVQPLIDSLVRKRFRLHNTSRDSRRSRTRGLLPWRLACRQARRRIIHSEHRRLPLSTLWRTIQILITSRDEYLWLGEILDPMFPW